jgi:hypothetical protein
MSRRTIAARVAAASGALLLIAAALGMVLAVGAASASVSAGPTFTHLGVIPNASGSMKKVIVLLRNKPASLGAATRAAKLRAEVRPLAQTLRSHGAKNVASGTAVPYVVASVSSAQEAALKHSSNVKAVFPDSVIPMPTSPVQSQGLQQLLSPLTSASPNTNPADPSTICGTAASPEQDPQAISDINAPAAWALGATGAGVSTAYIAGDIDSTVADFQRNSAYASSGSPTASPVVTKVNFDGDTSTTPAGEVAGESFLDASSIAAQGNTTYDLNDYVNAANPLPTPCDITVTGAAPGASVTGLDVFSNTHDTTESNFVEAINYAAANGVQVLNESFGSNAFPDTAMDATRIADDDAVAAGVTVVVSTGDAGVGNTLGSPSTDPNLISAGASTTFRSYQQLTYGGIDATVPNATNGTWLDDNISSISSAGFSQSGGNTVDIVAPGDSNWALCSTAAQFSGSCASVGNGVQSPIEFTGGTSESSPLTAAAAADVIQAYQSTHSGDSPTPALVKQILMSTATDINAPAEQQGAGLLNIGAAVKDAEAVNGGSGTDGGLLISPSQINITQNPGQSKSPKVSVTNTGTHTVSVNLSTRTIKNQIGNQTGSFCLNPQTSGTNSCGGPPTGNPISIWSGATEVSQEETFTVPTSHGRTSRLDFSATYPNTGQTSLLHVALYDPSGAYAGYSLPQGLADFADMQVTNPMPGTWTAVFFTVQNGGNNHGTSGTINWQATTWSFAPAGTISPSTLAIPAGGTKTATFTATSGSDAGDTAQSIVLNSSDGSTTSVPVTVRTMIPIASVSEGGAFKGVLTGGNGRGNPANSDTYTFHVPAGVKDLDVKANLGDVRDEVVAFLTDPEGNTVANSSNDTLNSAGNARVRTGEVDVYKDNPQRGDWTLALDWTTPVSGLELSEPFTGHVSFNRVRASATGLPTGGGLNQGQVYNFNVTVTNTAGTPETYFLDPRLTTSTEYQLPDQNSGSDQNMSLPLPPGLSFPFYIVPTDTSALETSLSGTAPVTYDIGPFAGDPDMEADSYGDVAALDYYSGDEVESGLWLLNPSEIGPYGPSGAPAATASDNFTVVTQAFDPTVDSATGDMWSNFNGLSSTPFDPVYLQPGQKATIPLTITPSASHGTHVHGVINLDDAFQLNDVVGFLFGSGDELASFPFSYTVK